MGKIIKIAASVKPDWRDSPLMQEMMKDDVERFKKVLKKYNQQLKKKS